MKKIKVCISLLLTIMGLTSLSAQNIEVKVGDAPDEKVKVTMGGRFYIDEAVYFDDVTPVGNGVSIPDLRLSMKADYKKWDFKIDMGFNDKKVSPKDIHARYNFNYHSWLRIGHMGPQFGNEGWETSAWIRFVAPAMSDQVFTLPRMIGAAYMNWNEKLYNCIGLFADPDAISNSKEGNQGFLVINKFNYTPLNDKAGTAFHVGATGYFRTGNRDGFDTDKKTKYTLSMSSNLNTKVSKLKAIGIDLDNVDYQATYVLEALFSREKGFIQGEYYHTNVKRKHGLDSYQANGFYVMGGFLLFGEKSYEYNMSERKLGHAKNNTLELLGRYNYTDLNDGTLNGGRSSDISIGLNYYLNKYIAFKLDYSYMALGKHNKLSPTGEKENVQALQGRLMVIF